jgi:hypothetical protein
LANAKSLTTKDTKYHEGKPEHFTLWFFES